METLNGKNLDNLIFKNSLTRIVDVQNFEGPLLTLFQDIITKNLYLFDWVDRDISFNRWVVYRCNPDTLNQFIKSKISHYDLFMSDESICYSIDIDKNIMWNNSQEIIKQDLSKSYLPQRDVFFEEVDCPNFKKLTEFIAMQSTHKYSKALAPKYASMTYSNMPNLKHFKYKPVSNNVFIVIDKSQYSDEINKVNIYNYKWEMNRSNVSQITKKVNSYA